jgi:hypothetical protein
VGFARTWRPHSDRDRPVRQRSGKTFSPRNAFGQ